MMTYLVKLYGERVLAWQKTLSVWCRVGDSLDEWQNKCVVIRGTLRDRSKQEPEFRNGPWILIVRTVQITQSVGSRWIMPINNSPIIETWLETDEFQETILALQLTSEQLSQLATTGNLHYWTWIIVCLHNALQGFMVLALRGTNNINVLTKDCA